jgi:hypothetical protein
METSNPCYAADGDIRTSATCCSKPSGGCQQNRIRGFQESSLKCESHRILAQSRMLWRGFGLCVHFDA